MLLGELAAQGKSSWWANFKHGLFDKLVFSKVRERFGGTLYEDLALAGVAQSRVVGAVGAERRLTLLDGGGDVERPADGPHLVVPGLPVGSVGRTIVLRVVLRSALAAFAIKHQLNPERKVHLQYTTTSPIMHQRLGVDG